MNVHIQTSHWDLYKYILVYEHTSSAALVMMTMMIIMPFGVYCQFHVQSVMVSILCIG